MKKFALLTGLAISSLMMAMAAEARDLRVTIINDSHKVMTHLYGSHRDTDSWENDIFGNDVLAPHQSVLVDFEDYSGYCIFDIRVIWEDGAEAVSWGQNVCEITSLTFRH